MVLDSLSARLHTGPGAHFAFIQASLLLASSVS